MTCIVHYLKCLWFKEKNAINNMLYVTKQVGQRVFNIRYGEVQRKYGPDGDHLLGRADPNDFHQESLQMQVEMNRADQWQVQCNVGLPATHRDREDSGCLYTCVLHTSHYTLCTLCTIMCFRNTHFEREQISQTPFRFHPVFRSISISFIGFQSSVE